MIKIIRGVFLSLLMTGSLAQAVVISSFGSNIAAGDLTGSWTGNYNSGTSTVVASVGPGAGIQDFDTAFASVIGQTSFQLTAAVSGTNPGTSFTITVFDQEGDAAFASFNWISFGTGLTTVSSAITFDPGFNSAPLGWELATGGTGQAITVQFSNLSAVPEPSTYGMLFLGLGTLIALRFRTRKSA